ncbi:hypothetical protein PYCC9005_004280 [Savitreella phatthalungensis]
MTHYDDDESDTRPVVMTINGLSDAKSAASQGSSPGSHFFRLTDSNELCFVELQGTIAKLDDAERRLGKLVQEDNGKIYLLVGYQRLEGKIVTLKKPIAVLRRKPVEACGDNPIDAETAPVREVELEVLEVCRKKIYFGIRPEPVGELLDGL